MQNAFDIGDVVRVLGLNHRTNWRWAVGIVVELRTKRHHTEYRILADHPLNHRSIEGEMRWVPDTLLRVEKGQITAPIQR